MEKKFSLFVATITHVKPVRQPLALLLFSGVLYTVLAMDVASLKPQIDALGATPDLPLFSLVMSNFLLRIGCLLMIPVAALRASSTTVLAALITGVFAVVAGIVGLAGQASYFALVAVFCGLVTWSCVGEEKVDSGTAVKPLTGA